MKLFATDDQMLTAADVERCHVLTGYEILQIKSKARLNGFIYGIMFMVVIVGWIVAVWKILSISGV
jgi:hypothetical protein